MRAGQVEWTRNALRQFELGSLLALSAEGRVDSAPELFGTVDSATQFEDRATVSSLNLDLDLDFRGNWAKNCESPFSDQHKNSISVTQTFN